LVLCDGNHCAAALLSFFGHWHNHKLANREQAMHANRIARLHGEEGKQDTSLLQFQNESAIEEGLLGLYGRKTIRVALDLLIEKGFVTVHKNPTTRYRFDHTRYFLFHPEAVTAQLLARADEVKVPDPENEKDEDYIDSNSSQAIDISDEVKIPDRDSTFTSSSGKNTSSSGKNTSTIPEITSEITSRDLGEGDTPPPAYETIAAQVTGTAGRYKPPKDFAPTPERLAQAARDAPHVDLELLTKRFKVITYKSQPLDWQDRWCQMVLEEEEKARERGSGGARSQRESDEEAAARHGLTLKSYRSMRNGAEVLQEVLHEQPDDAGRRPPLLRGPQ